MMHMSTPANAHVVDVDEGNFEQVLARSQELPIILDFWAEWCGPCKTLGPILEALAEAYDGAFLLAKIDVDKNPQLASHFQAQSIPAVFAVYRGAMVDRFAGALPKAEVEAFLQRVFEGVGIDAKPVAVDDTTPMDPAAAEGYWRTALANDQADTAAKLALGRLLFSKGEIAEAETLLDSIPGASRDYNAAQ
ncbi:MAG: putative thioredoxin, partial [Myxococcota bacterium]